MADTEGALEFLEGGVGMFFDMGLELVRVKFAPVAPALFRGQRSRLGGRQVAIDGAASEFKASGRLDFGAAVLDEPDHPLPQIQCIGFHARNPIILCANVNMKCYKM